MQRVTQGCQGDWQVRRSRASVLKRRHETPHSGTTRSPALLTQRSSGPAAALGADRTRHLHSAPVTAALRTPQLPYRLAAVTVPRAASSSSTSYGRPFAIDAPHPDGVGDVRQRIAVEDDEVGQLAGLDGAGVEAQRLRRVHGRGLQRVERAHAGHRVGHQLAVQVDGVRRVGAGHHQAAGLHDVEHHLAAAAARDRRRRPGLAAAGCCGHLPLDPLGIEREARIVLQRGIELEQPARAGARRSSGRRCARSCRTAAPRPRRPSAAWPSSASSRGGSSRRCARCCRRRRTRPGRSRAWPPARRCSCANSTIRFCCGSGSRT